MLGPKVVFVVGAGASFELKLPLGSELRQIIANKLDFHIGDLGGYRGLVSGDEDIHDLVRRLNLQAAARSICNNVVLVDSIDDFVETHAADEKIRLCSKASIVQSILQAERNSLIYCDQRDPSARIDWSAMEGTWLLRLFRLMRVGVGRGNIADFGSEVGFITFNYDRTIEHFLKNAVRDLFAISDESAEQTIDKIPIYHPYGTVGRLPWQSGGELPRGFGASASSHDLESLYPGIKTYSEQADSGAVKTIHGLLAEAETVVFLGFGFHAQNMRLLTPVGGIRPQRVFGTAYLRSAADVDLIRHRRIGKMIGDAESTDVVLENYTCADFIRDYGAALMNAV